MQLHLHCVLFFFSMANSWFSNIILQMDSCHQYNIYSLHMHIFICSRAHKEHMVLLYPSIQISLLDGSSKHG